MPIKDKDQLVPDLMSVHMKAALDERGIDNTFMNFPWRDRKGLYKTWLSFSVGEKPYYYASGMLIEAGETDWDLGGRWGKIGRNINYQAWLLIADKFKTKQRLEEASLGVPKGKMFRRRKIEEAFEAFDTFDKPVCVKPNRGSEGRNVFANISARPWYEQAIRQCAVGCPNIVVEESVSGHHFRFFYIEPHVVAIRLGVPFQVIGDGVSTIGALMDAKNAERVERALPTHAPYPLNPNILNFLAMQDRDLDDVPAEGEVVVLAGTSNGTAGADTLMVALDEVHPSYLEAVEKACQIMPGLHYSGVDIIVKDMKQPAAPGNYWILELNASPAITGYYYPWEGEKIDIAGMIVDYLATRSVST